MCGITGILAFTEEGKKHLDKIGDAVKSLHHRGPDGSGVFRHGNVALGHTRLAIIDTSNAAAQPFTSADGRYTIVFNGEIFNYKELRAELEKEGCTFRSQSDTEVLLAMYAKQGKDCLNKLNGFFAFAVYDSTGETLFLARDRYGEKPLYFATTSGSLLFGSEPAAIIALGFQPELDDYPLHEYLHQQYVTTGTFFNGIVDLPPGQFIFTTVRNTAAALHMEAWYDLPSKSASNSSYREAVKRVRNLCDAAVQRRLISDVPVGCFLSGGVDSSIVAALAAKHKTQLETFSIGFADEPFFDETKYAELVARHIGTKHHVFNLTNRQLLNSAQEILEKADHPFADSSAIAVNILCAETRKHVTVALSGDGADELFGGYNKHAAEIRIREKSMINKLVGWGAPLWNSLPASRGSLSGNKVRQLRKFSGALELSSQQRYILWCGLSGKESVTDLIQRNYDDIDYYFDGMGSNGYETMNDVLREDIRHVLADDMLVKVDRMSMLNGLEVRSPFLDHELVEYVMSLPSEYKINRHERKRVLKDACRDLLPQEIFTRRKQGFEVPLLKWFRGDLRGMIDELLNEKFLKEQNLFNPVEVKNIRGQLDSNDPGDAAARIWGLIVFQSWWKKYIQ